MFYYRHPKSGEDVVVPAAGRTASGLKQLAGMARSALIANGIEVPPNFRKIVEHQVCMRQGDPKSACWSDGAGDSLHHWVAKPILSKVASAADAVGLKPLARAARRVRGCSSCGGSRVYVSGENPLGRAGTLNRALKRRKAK